MKIVLYNVLNNKKIAMNKDLNGGLGTADNYSGSITTQIISWLKSRWVRIPVISYAFIQAILKEKNHDTAYCEVLDSSWSNPDIVLIYGSLVDYVTENSACKKVKELYPKAKVGIFGPFPSRFPSYYANADFVLNGDAESFFLHDFKELNQLNGIVKVSAELNMDELPTPDFDGFPINNYRYYPAIRERPFLVLQASKGCPYSCGYYCSYGEYQGVKYRQRSAEKVVADIMALQAKYGIKGIQFRDPTFGINKQFINDFYTEMKKKNIQLAWGMETRLDLLNREILDKLYEVGLRNINVGIETSDKEIAAINKRQLVQETHQEEMIHYCKKLGIQVSAFYIIGYEGDTEETIKSTFDYAIHLGTDIARFSVSTPYPGTRFYDQLKNDGRLITENFENYTQFNLVFKHKSLSPEKIQDLLRQGMRRYYTRPKYLLKFLGGLV